VRITNLIRGVCVAAVLVAATPAAAQVQLNPVASNLSSPVFVGNAGDGSHRLFIVEQGGIIKVLQPGGSTPPTVFLNITARVLSGGERGLLGLAFHPLYSSNRRFFVFYTQQTDGALVIAEYLTSPTDPNVAGTTERRILQIPHPGFSNHNGGMLAFGPDGYLYIGVGDGGGSYDPNNNAQNINSLLGKILRIDIDRTQGTNQYASPGDNPFVGIDGRDEIYAYGMRNPWRFSFDRTSGQQWVGDVGQGAREEVDTPIVNGGNYGWPVREGTLCTPQYPGCTSQGFEEPLFEYAHSGGRCSLTGGYMYGGSQSTFQTDTYIFGDFCSGEIITWYGSQQTLLLETALAISSFGEDEQGELYVVNLNGSVSRIAGTAPPPPPCTYSISPTRASFGPGGGNGSVTVTTGGACEWTAASNASWITVTGGSAGSGSGTVDYTVEVYTGKPKRRTGTITVAGQTLTVTQTK
jgi:glucose/arabinose dehydrogenase